MKVRVALCRTLCFALLFFLFFLSFAPSDVYRFRTEMNWIEPEPEHTIGHTGVAWSPVALILKTKNHCCFLFSAITTPYTSTTESWFLHLWYSERLQNVLRAISASYLSFIIPRIPQQLPTSTIPSKLQVGYVFSSYTDILQPFVYHFSSSCLPVELVSSTFTVSN